jgi:hypothetical protein
VTVKKDPATFTFYVPERPANPGANWRAPCCVMKTHVRERKLPQPLPCALKTRGPVQKGGPPQLTCRAHYKLEDKAQAFMMRMQELKNMPFEDLLSASSLGEPDVVARAASVPQSEVDKILNRAGVLAQSWECAARPAMLNGRRCGHRNTKGVVHSGLLCCEACGATKYASDDRHKREQRQ